MTWRLSVQYFSDAAPLWFSTWVKAIQAVFYPAQAVWLVMLFLNPPLDVTLAATAVVIIGNAPGYCMLAIVEIPRSRPGCWSLRVQRVLLITSCLAEFGSDMASGVSAVRQGAIAASVLILIGGALPITDDVFAAERACHGPSYLQRPDPAILCSAAGCLCSDFQAHTTMRMDVTTQHANAQLARVNVCAHTRRGLKLRRAGAQSGLRSMRAIAGAGLAY